MYFPTEILNYLFKFVNNDCKFFVSSRQYISFPNLKKHIYYLSQKYELKIILQLPNINKYYQLQFLNNFYSVHKYTVTEKVNKLIYFFKEKYCEELFYFILFLV